MQLAPGSEAGATQTHPQLQQRPLEVQSYQTPVANLRGWNDPPSLNEYRNVSHEDLIGQETKIMNTLNGILEIIRGIYEMTPQRRIVEDTEKRMQLCLDRMRDQSMHLGAKSILVDIMTGMSLRNFKVPSQSTPHSPTHSTNLKPPYSPHPAVNAKDFATAQSQITKLNTNFVDESRWIIGLKRLVELWQQVCNGATA